MDSPAIIERLTAHFGSAVLAERSAGHRSLAGSGRGAVAEDLQFLRDEPALRFNMLNCVTGVDYFEADAKKAAAAGWQPHVEVLYHLSAWCIGIAWC